MSMYSVIVALAASAGLAWGQPAQPEVTIYRSWRAPDLTVVEGMFRVDPSLLGTPDCVYGVELTVRDREGTRLMQERWAGRCPEQEGRLAAALETFQFAMPQAQFTVDVTVFPESQPAHRHTRTVEVQSLAARPLTSDLILAREVGFVDSTNTGMWTLRRGDIGVQASSQIIVEPQDPTLSYYIELYASEPEPFSGNVLGVVKRADGRELARFPLQALADLREPRPVAGEVSVAGLPPGDYHFEMRVELEDTTVVRSHPFRVMSAQAAVAEGGGWFYTLTDERLAELFDPVVLWLTSSEAELYPTLPSAAKREFLSGQFGREGPTPNDGQQSALDDYLARVEVVNARFAERAGRGVRGAWLTPRGRIYLLRGEPTSTITKPSPQGGAPYEIWHYATGQGLVYLFADETRMGAFRLIFTNDPNQQSIPNWQNRVSADALDDLARFGVRVPRDGTPDAS